MTPLEAVNAEWHALRAREEFNVPVDLTSPLAGCVVRFDHNGNILLVFGGTYVCRPDPDLVREIASIMNRQAHLTREAINAHQPLEPTKPRKLSLSNLDLDI